MIPAADAPLRFGPGGRFELQPLQRRLLVDGEPAALGARAFDLLVELASRPGVLRSKHELIDAVWPGVVVEEGNLATQISTLRRILGGEVIATIPGRGYRFAAAVVPAQDAAVDEGAAPAPPAAPPALPPAAPEKLRTNLPAELPPLIGRADDLAALRELVAQHRLVSIVGAGGMGKTALAQTFLHGQRDAYPDGVCWVDVAPVNDTQALPAAVAAALGLTLGGGEPVVALCGAVAPLTLLLVLDNAEHLLEATAQVAQALLDAAPGLRLLVTSQVPLKLAAECVHRLDALDVPQGPLPAVQARVFGAVALFEARAMQADSRWRLTDDNAPAVIEVCRALVGGALAIELAAARAPMLGVHKLAASMDERLKLLGGGRNRMAPARQQTLRAALEWSHGFLDAAERAVFRRLAVLAGSGTLALVQAVVADPPGEGALDAWAALDALALLVDRSLVVAFTTDAGDTRYRLLETLRLFALEQLRAAGEEEALRQRHARAMAARMVAAWNEGWSGTIGRDAWREKVAADIDNAWHAHVWACEHDEREAALRIAAVLLAVPAYLPRAALRALCERCEPWLQELPDVELHAHFALGIAVMEESVSLARAERVLRAAQDRVAAAAALPSRPWLLHWLAARRSAYLAHLGHLEEARIALADARRHDNPAWPACRRLFEAPAASVLALVQGDHVEALRQLQRQQRRLEAAGASIWFNLVNQADLQLATGDAAAATATGREIVTALAGSRIANALAGARANLAAGHLTLGETPAARENLQAGWAEAQRAGCSSYFADYLALLAAQEARPRAAARLAGFADAVNATAGQRLRNEEAAIVRATDLARAALGDAAFVRLHAEGAALGEAEVTAIAFATDDAA